VTEFSEQLVGLRLWNADGTLLFDANPSTSAPFPQTDPFDRAVRDGEVSARVVTITLGATDGSGTAGRQVTALSVYVPVTENAVRVGALEVVLDYTETDEALREAVQVVATVISVGLLVLWLLLFRTVRNASKRLQTSALENARLALLDPLTGLPNRRMLLDRMRRAIDQAEEDGTGVGLVLLDIDRFKDINDSLVSGNLFENNSAAIYFDGSNRTELSHNEFIRNGYALRVLSNSMGSLVRYNNFIGNTFDVTTNADRSFNSFDQNYWDQYQGYDLDRDGVGDVPYRPVRLFALTAEAYPQALVLLRSPLSQVMDYAERLLPVLTPKAIEDDRPLMGRIRWSSSTP